MESALRIFRSNIARARDLGGLHSSLNEATTSALDLSDLLRAQFVLGLSSFDTFIHEITRIGMLEAADGLRPKTESFQRFQVEYRAIPLNQSTPDTAWLDAEIRRKHSFATFQAPDKVAEALRLIADISLWEEVGRSLSTTSRDVKDRLSLVVQRRNKIAHEADCDPTFPEVRWPIDSDVTEEMLKFLLSLGEAIHSLVKL